MRHIFLLLLTITCAAIAAAQSPGDVLTKLWTNYAAGHNCNYQMVYNFYAGDEKKPVESLNGITQYFDDIYYFKIGNIEQLSDKQWTLTVNHDESYVIADKAEKYTGLNKQMSISEILSKINNEENRMETTAISNDMTALKIFEKEESSPSWEIAYRQENYEISMVKVYFNKMETEALYGDEYDSSRLEIGIKNLPVAEPSTKINTVIDWSGSAVKLQPKFKKYTLYDLSAQK